MKNIRLLIIFSFFCILGLCAGKGISFSTVDKCCNIGEEKLKCNHTSAEVQDYTASYIQTVRSNYFMAASSVTNVAERVPVQTVNSNNGNVCGGIRGGYNQRNKRWLNQCAGGLKVASSIISFVFLSYHKAISALSCNTFSKCYILALGKLLC